MAEPATTELTNRRGFLEAMGASAFATAAGQDIIARGRPVTPGDNFLEPGLVYLNTGSLGPASRTVLDRTVEAWQALEANPVFQSYANGPAHRATVFPRDSKSPISSAGSAIRRVTSPRPASAPWTSLSVNAGPRNTSRRTIESAT